MQQLDFSIIDPHLHQWDPYQTPHAARTAVKLFGKSPWLLDRAVRFSKSKPFLDTLGLTQHATRPYLPEDYAKDIGQYKVEQVVHVEAEWHHQKGKGVVEETEFVRSLPFAVHGLKLGGIVASADPSDSNFKKILKMHLKSSPLVRGIRKKAAVHEDPGVYSWHKDAHLYRQKAFLKGFEQIAMHKLSFDAWVYSTQLQDLTLLARQFPETNIVLDHLGTPAGIFGQVGKYTGLTATNRQNIFKRWQDDLAELAELPNVYTKLSGVFMPVLGHQFYQYNKRATKQEIIDLTTPLVMHALQCFGSYRLMFASNFPMDSVNVNLVDLIDAWTDIIAQYDPDAVSRIFRTTAKQFYRL